jgi:hypothetical protein
MKYIKNVIFVVIAILLIPICSEAMSVSIGFNAWYAWWNPPAPDLSHRPYADFASYTGLFYPLLNVNKININDNVMYGPYIRINVPYNISMSSIFLYGQFNANKKDYYNGLLGNIVGTMDKLGYIKRYESDSKIRYSIIDMVSVFAGFKYNHVYYETMSFSELYSTIFSAGKQKILNFSDEYMPQCGAGIDIHALKNALSVSLDAAFLFCFANNSTHQKDYIGKSEASSQYTCVPHYTIRQSMKKIGINTTADFKYTIPIISTTVSVGFRYQMLKNLKKESDKAMEYEHMYGITASAEYVFSFKTAGDVSSEKIL